MIQARLKKTFNARPDAAPFALDIEIAASSGVTVLFGPSGSGKTLTLDLIAGFVKADQGRILLDDDILYDASTGVHLPPQGRHCGYVFQNYALFPHMTLRENLVFAAERSPRLERHRRVADMLERFRLNDLAGRRPHEVSGGQRQRCSIARALIGSPKLLLLDEPAQGLDAPLRAELYEVLRQVRAEFEIPAILVTHDLDECLELGDHMLVLSGGKIVQSGSPSEILRQPASAEIARLLGDFNLIPAAIEKLDPGRNTSRVRVGDVEIDGPYFPGKLLGDRITLCVRAEQLSAAARSGKLGANQVPAELRRKVEKARGMRLEFLLAETAVIVDLPWAMYEPLLETEQWVVQFPRETLRVL